MRRPSRLTNFLYIYIYVPFFKDEALDWSFLFGSAKHRSQHAYFKRLNDNKVSN